MKRLFVYLKIISIFKTYLTAKAVFRELMGEEGYEIKKKFHLEDDEGNVIENPTITKSSIELLLPISKATITSKLQKNYILDQKSDIDLIFAYACVLSFITVNIEEKYTEKREMVAVVRYTLKIKQLFISITVWIFILFILSLLTFFLLK